MSDPELPALSTRERQLLKLAAAGLKDAAISARLEISEATVKTYWRRIRAKLGQTSRTELVAKVLKGEIQKANARPAAWQNYPPGEKEQTSFYKLLIDQAPDAILIVNRAGIINVVNESAVDLFGWGENELVGEHISMLLPERFRAGHGAHLALYFDAPSRRAMADHLETFALHRMGAEIAIAANLSAFGDGEATSVICVVRALHLPK